MIEGRCAMQLAGRALPSPVHLPTCLVHLPICLVHLPICLVHLPNSRVHLSISLVHLPMSLVHLPMSLVHLPNSPVHLPNSLVHLPVYLVHLQGLLGSACHATNSAQGSLVPTCYCTLSALIALHCRLMIVSGCI